MSEHESWILNKLVWAVWKTLPDHVIDTGQAEWARSEMGKVLKPLVDRVEKLEEREVHWRSYAKLLGEALNSAAGFLHVHGWKWEEEKIQKGKELRALLGIDDHVKAPRQ